MTIALPIITVVLFASLVAFLFAAGRVVDDLKGTRAGSPGTLQPAS